MQLPPPQGTPPSAPPPPISVVVGPVAGVPTTGRELRALRERRSELSSQLTSASGRREDLADELKDADPDARAGLLERIAVLDQRIAQLESDIALTGRQLTAAPAALIAQTESRGPFGIDGDAPVWESLAFAFLLVALISFARRIWKGPRPAQPAPSESTQRLDRIEQAIEAVAIEVERISEGQRFVTRLLSEGNRLPTLGAGKREPEAVRTPER